MKVLHNSKSKPGVMAYKGNPSTQKNSKSLRSIWVPYTEWYLVKTKTNNLKKYSLKFQNKSTALT